MQIELSFIFPHVLRELPVGLLIPVPAQRPRTVANLAFMSSGQLPLPEELMNALRLSSSDVAYATADDAKAAGLVPFSDSAVIRIDKTTVMEIGSSTTRSIFGGFIPDESVHLPADTLARGQSIAATMVSLKAGTVLYGNLGMPNTQASRYYILLTSLTTAQQKEEFSGFAPLGMVTSGLAELQRAVNQTAVQPRTLVPKKKVVVSACRMQLDYAQLTALSTTAGAGATSPAAAGIGERRKAEPQERIAGRVRRRDEDVEDEEQQRNASDTAAVGDTTTAATAHGFFQMSARFPKAVAQAVASTASGGSALKRRRAEAYVTGADGVAVLRTTAVAPGEHGSNGDGEQGFEFFQAQEDAFLNDIDVIKGTQQERHNRKTNKSKKKQAYSRKHQIAKTPKRAGSGGGASSSKLRSASQSKAGKKVVKRY